MKFIIVILTVVSLSGCVGGRYVHHNLDQQQANQVAFECKYKAELMSQSYKSLYSVIDFADNYDQCLRANGFVKQ